MRIIMFDSDKNRADKRTWVQDFLVRRYMNE